MSKSTTYYCSDGRLEYSPVEPVPFLFPETSELKFRAEGVDDTLALHTVGETRSHKHRRSTPRLYLD